MAAIRLRSMALLWAMSLGAGCTERIFLPLGPGGPADVDAAAIDASAPRVRMDTGGEPVDAAAISDAPGPGASDGGARVPTVCEYRSHTEDNPHVVLSLDRSASMHVEKLGGTVTRIQAVEQQLLPLVRQHEHAIHFGYQEFPVRCPPGTCCASWVMEPDSGAYSRIRRSLQCEPSFEGCLSKEEDSPSAEALRRINSFFVHRFNDGHLTPRTRLVLLITDGDPACAGERPSDLCDKAVQQIQQLRDPDLNVSTLVVGLGADGRPGACLERMAAAGGVVGAAPARVRTILDEAQLKKELEELLAALSLEACRFRIKFTPTTSGGLLVLMDDQPVRWDPTRRDGWDFDGASHSRFTVYGPLCDRLRTADVDVDVYSCPEK